jgi:hypothetical protein
MHPTKHCKYVIQGITESGSKFRPSDWIDRIASLDAEYGSSHRLVYSDNIHPEVFEGERSLIIDMNLKETNPSLLDYVMDFVRMNQLRMVQVCYLDGEYVEAPEAKREQAMRDA